MNLFFRVCGRFFDEGRGKTARFGGVLMVKSWWMCGELWSVERLFSRGENLPHFSTLFCRFMAKLLPNNASWQRAGIATNHLSLAV